MTDPAPSEETRAAAARADGLELSVAFGLAFAALLVAGLALCSSAPVPYPTEPADEAPVELPDEAP